METVTQAIEELAQQLVALGNTLVIIAILISVVPYILFGIGINSVASRYGLRNKWMAWIPIARKHLLTELADLRRAQVGKQRKLVVQFEIIMCLFLACIYIAYRSSDTNTLMLILPAILGCLLTYNQAFSYYYFYRLCDLENSTAYFLLGLMVSPLNSFFVFHCR